MIRCFTIVALLASGCQTPGTGSVTPEASVDMAVQSTAAFKRDGTVLEGGGGEIAVTFRNETGRHLSLFYRGHSFVDDTLRVDRTSIEPHDLFFGVGGLRVSQRFFSRSLIGLGLGFGSATLHPVAVMTPEEEEKNHPRRQTLGQLDATYELRLIENETGLFKSLSCQVGVIGNFENGGDLELKDYVPSHQYYAGISFVMVPGHGIVNYSGTSDFRAAGMMFLFADIPSGVIYFASSSIKDLVVN
jgi:hypothetical protein